MKLLGIRLDDHDSNFCLYDDGKISYLKTERVYQVKHHAYNNNWEWTLDLEKYFNVSISDIDEIAIVADPLRYNIPQHLDFKTKKHEGIKNCTHVEHHLAHALSSPENETEWQFVFDGVGEVFQNQNNIQGTVWSVFKNYNLKDRNTSDFEYNSDSSIRVKNSFGVEYENCARHLGITAEHPDDLAGKLMSLQSYGSIDYGFLEYLNKRTEWIKDQLTLACHPMNWGDYLGSEKVAELNKLNFAATIHEYMGDQILSIIKQFANTNDSILLTGGCALNICWNTKIKKLFPNTIIMPHSADEGLSIGALHYLIKKHGLQFKWTDYPFCQQDEAPPTIPNEETFAQVVDMLCQGKIIGWYQGNGEIGPRALGNRSILMNPEIKNAKDIINRQVKHREDYRPFGASILKRFQKDYFDLDIDNHYMLYLGMLKKSLPAITHVDGSCRFQTVDNSNSLFETLLEKFYSVSGCPVLLNTSLNRGGKPIAGSKKDALGVLYETELDALVYGNEIIKKENNARIF